MNEPTPPDFAALEQRIVDELQAAIATVGEQFADRPLAAFVLWADPYKGWYELHVDTHERNAAGARARNAKMLARLPELAGRDEAWKTAMTVAGRTQALPFDPRYGEFVSCDDPVHTFDVDVTGFVRSPSYAALNVGGEDGWLEGHVRFVIARALARLVEARAFDALARGPQLYVGYAYTDSSDAVIVAIVEDVTRQRG